LRSKKKTKNFKKTEVQNGHKGIDDCNFDITLYSKQEVEAGTNSQGAVNAFNEIRGERSLLGKRA